MKRITVFFFLGLISLLPVKIIHAQDSRLPHPYMWKSFNNPGYTGFDGLVGVNMGIRRSYWTKPLDFRTYYLSLDYPFKGNRELGLGGVSLLYMRDEERSLMYVTDYLSGAFSTRVKLSNSTVLQLGFQPALYFKSLDRERLTLADQFDPYYGQMLAISPELVDFYKDNIVLFDLAAGIYGKTDFYGKSLGYASIEYGFSVYHIIESTQSFLSQHGSVSSTENLLHRRYSGYLSYKHPFYVDRYYVLLSPYFMLDAQSVMRNIQYGIYLESEDIGMFGLGLRSNQYDNLNVGTLLINLGLSLPMTDNRGWKIGYTCEVPTNQGTMYKNTSHSLSLHWYFKLNPKRCERMFDEPVGGTNKKLNRRSKRNKNRKMINFLMKK